jgi:uncharacterized protein (DUF302 family)
LTEIGVQATLKKKLAVHFGPDRNLGECDPPFAHRALQQERKIGTMLLCTVVVRETEAGAEIATVDPAVSMVGVDNPGSTEIAEEVRQKLPAVVRRAAARERPWLRCPLRCSGRVLGELKHAARLGCRRP